MKAKILIVGGGVMGTSLAIEAARRTDPLRAPVVLVEKGDIGAGSSGRSGAILRQHYADRATAVMARDSLRAFASFEGRTGRSIGFRRTGVLTIVGPDQPEWAQRVRDNTAMLGGLGIRAELVDAARMRQLVPGMTVREGSLGVWEPDGGFVQPHKTLEAFASLARSYGAVTRRGVAVLELHVEGGRVRGARTSEGTIDAEQVVVTAGPWTRRLLASAGVDLPLRTLRPENVFFPISSQEEGEEKVAERGGANLEFDIEDDPDQEGSGGISQGQHPTLIDLENSLYCRYEPALRCLRVGRTDYEGDRELEDPDALQEAVSHETRAWARGAIGARFPEFGDRQESAAVAGWYTMTPDAQAIIDRVPGIDGLFVAAGFSGHGFKLGPSVGEGLAQLLFEEPLTAFEPEFFSLRRFASGAVQPRRFGL